MGIACRTVKDFSLLSHFVGALRAKDGTEPRSAPRMEYCELMVRPPVCFPDGVSLTVAIHDVFPAGLALTWRKPAHTPGLYAAQRAAVSTLCTAVPCKKAPGRPRRDSFAFMAFGVDVRRPGRLRTEAAGFPNGAENLLGGECGLCGGATQRNCGGG